MEQYCSSSGYNVSNDFIYSSSRNKGTDKTFFNFVMEDLAEVDDSTNSTKDVKFDGCNLHAFCKSCVEDDSGTIKDSW